MKLAFYGAARAVTGSCHMILSEKSTVLIDCGMRQGLDAKGAYGEGDFPFDPRTVDAVVLTHAHIDHSGLLPLLVKRGFAGRILCTEATAQLCSILLPDSAHIQQQDAEWQNRKNTRAGKPLIEPLYTLDDAAAALKLMHGANYNETVQLRDDIRVRLVDAGHLLGSASAEVFVAEGGKTIKLAFSGDIGRSNRPIIRDPQPVIDADYLIMEGTYGNKNHGIEADGDKEAELVAAMKAAFSRGGNLVIPSFAVGRTQELLYYIKRILQKGILPELNDIPVYIDSPLGIEATKIYERCAAGYYDEEATRLSKDGSPFDFPTLRVAQTADESKLINDVQGKKIIISSSGMCDAGRIRHHLKHNLYRADSTILFVGYQAQGTLGRALIDGLKKAKLFGEEVRVNASIAQVEGFSGHAGRDELIAWANAVSPKPQKIFLVHGEEVALMSLAQALVEQGQETEVPYLGDAFDILPGEMRAETSLETGTPEIVDVQEKAYGYAVREQLARMQRLLDRTELRRSPDMALKLVILEADLKSLVDKWKELL